jgi:ABC-2 type transport system ATP-binding protein
MNRDNVIQTDRLTRYFGKRVVVQELNFSVPRGSIVGLLGLNGAGKSTAIRMMMGFLTPTRGRCEILGRNSQDLRPEDRVRIGYAVEGHFLYPWMKVQDCEAFGRDTFPRWNREQFYATIDRFGIAPSQKVNWLSRGQRAGVSLASTISSDPELLVLDDPALGLDPVSRRALNETLLDFNDSGTRTVLISSHMLDDIERICDRIAIMVAGRILVDCKLDDFRSRIAAWSIESSSDPGIYGRIPGLIHSHRRSHSWVVTVANPNEATLSALEQLGAVSCEPVDITFEEAVIAYLARSRRSDTFLSGARAAS